MCTFLSKPFSLSSISQDSLIQIPCYVQPALGPPRSCLLPRPALKKAGTDSKNLSIREGKWSTAQFQPDSLQTGRTVRAALCRDSAAGQSQAEMSQVEENGCWDAQKVHRRRARVPHWLPSMTFKTAEDTRAGNYYSFFFELFLVPEL